MSPRKRTPGLWLIPFVMLVALSCQLVTGDGTPVPPTATASMDASPTPSSTDTAAPPAVDSETPTAIVVVTFTVTMSATNSTAYPGPEQTIPAYPGPVVPPIPTRAYPGPGDTDATDTPVLPTATANENFSLDTPTFTPALALSGTVPATLDAGPTAVQVASPTGVGSSPVPTFTLIPSPTPVFVPTSTPTLPANLNLTGTWTGFRRIDIKHRDCEERIAHSLRWRIVQDKNYNLKVNNDLTGWLKGHVVTLSGLENFFGDSLDLTYILTVGPTRHELSGYMWGEAQLSDVCGFNRRWVNVPSGRVDVER